MQVSMDRSFINNTISTFSNGIIDSVDRDRDTTLVTVTYSDCFNCQRRNDTIRLVAGRDTITLDEFGNRMPASRLMRGMIINATFSSAMTRSIPPQSNAFVIQVVSRPSNQNTTTGRIVTINRNNRNFTTVQDGNPSSLIQFNVPMDAQIFDIFGRPMNFNQLVPGLRVRVNHANFMTASIPPQTTAFEVRVLR